MTAPGTIVIAGAGIGGLTAALALAAKGFRIVILEKSARLEEAGAGLQLSPNASRILIDLGLRDRLAARATTPDAVTIFGARGSEVAVLPLDHAGAPYWVIHRADLQAALLDAVLVHPAIEVKLGCRFDDVAAHARGITVGASAGGTQRQQVTQALIGADGLWSAVRGRLFPAVQPRPAGLTAWRGTIDTDRLPLGLAARGVQLYLGANAHLVAYPVAGGRQINLVAIVSGNRDRPGWSEPGDAADIRQRFAARHWSGPARTLVSAVESWRTWALFTLRDGGAWADGNVALLGDAAHAMLPFAAQGAGMAIEDAAILAICLGETGGDVAQIPSALQRYAALRRPRVTRVQRTARLNGRIYHLAGPLALARDLAMRRLGGERLLSRQDWIYDWQP